jgi:hypothetical protein
MILYPMRELATHIAGLRSIFYSASLLLRVRERTRVDLAQRSPDSPTKGCQSPENQYRSLNSNLLIVDRR